MQITILAYGSRGDVQPYVALGVGLHRAGHDVRLAAPEAFCGFVTRYGLDFAPLAGDPTSMVRGLVDQAGENPIRAIRVMAAYTFPLARQVIADILAACQGTDLVIHSFLLLGSGHAIARMLGVPDVATLTIPALVPTGDYPVPMWPKLPLGRAYNRFTHLVSRRIFWWANRAGYAWVRRIYSELPRHLEWPFEGRRSRPVPTLCAFSPTVVTRPLDWGKHVHLTGYWFLESGDSWQPPPDLLSFLGEGPPPVYIGFGSVVTEQANHLPEVVLSALKETGQRGILASGWGGLSPKTLPPWAFTLDAAPHDWLFPRCAALIHHGGAGTTAAGLLAGKPTVIVPFGSDQPFWGDRIYQIGAGPQPIPRRRLTAKTLASAIEFLTTDRGVAERAQSVGESIAQERGVDRAIEIIQNHTSSTRSAQ